MDYEESNLTLVNNNEEALSNALLNAPTTFDDVLSEPVRISLIEFQPYKAGEDLDGKPIIRRKPVRRIAEINTYVPMRILHKMMASQAKLKQMQAMQRQAVKGEISDENQSLMIEWMIDQILGVWQLTEPDMTRDGLMDGLSFQKIYGLFTLFFGDLIKTLNNKL